MGRLLTLSGSIHRCRRHRRRNDAVNAKCGYREVTCTIRKPFFTTTTTAVNMPMAKKTDPWEYGNTS